MRIFRSLLIVVSGVILFLLPIIPAVQDFRTNTRTDPFLAPTGANTSVIEPLSRNVYAADASTISALSDLATDNPTISAYDDATRQVTITGLTAASNRTLEVSYAVNAFASTSGISLFLDKLPLIWLLTTFAFIPAAIIALFFEKKLR